ncbi:MAG: hypothetical protein P8Y95_18045, partial [Gammaproteobacteria bacterium]
MAREAIALARTTRNRRVLYETLRSAVSALMDFAPAEERVVLNREYTALAAEFHDVPEQFRGNLRLMIDASELANGRAMEEAIAMCADIARRLDLPHYSWRAASCRAMREMIVGDIEAARVHIDEAEVLAGRAGDRGAKLTLAIQRFGLLRDAGADFAPTLSEVEARLDEAFVRIPYAKRFVEVQIAGYRCRTGDRVAGAELAESGRAAEVLGMADRSSTCALGEIAMELNDRELAKDVARVLEPFAGTCGHFGIMGSLWDGPVDYTLGLLAAYLDDRDAAQRHF